MLVVVVSMGIFVAADGLAFGLGARSEFVWKVKVCRNQRVTHGQLQSCGAGGGDVGFCIIVTTAVAAGGLVVNCNAAGGHLGLSEAEREIG